MRSRLAAFVALAVAPLVLFALLPLLSSGRSLQEKIDAAQHRLDRVKHREGVLSSDVASVSRRISGIQSEITGLHRRQDVLQRDLDGKRVTLNRLQSDLRAERAQLAE